MRPDRRWATPRCTLLDRTNSDAWRQPSFRPTVTHRCENGRTGYRSSKQGADRVRLQFGLQPDDALDLNRERGAEGCHFERLLVQTRRKVFEGHCRLHRLRLLRSCGRQHPARSRSIVDLTLGRSLFLRCTKLHIAFTCAARKPSRACQTPGGRTRHRCSPDQTRRSAARCWRFSADGAPSLRSCRCR